MGIFYFLPALENHTYSTRFASEYNWVAVMCSNITVSQRSKIIEGHRLWNSLPEKTKHLNNKVFFNKLKKFLIENNILSKKDIEE